MGARRNARPFFRSLAHVGCGRIFDWLRRWHPALEGIYTGSPRVCAWLHIAVDSPGNHGRFLRIDTARMANGRLNSRDPLFSPEILPSSPSMVELTAVATKGFNVSSQNGLFMNYIVLDPTQTASVAAATDPLEVRAPDGTVLGFIHRQRPAAPEPQEDPHFSAANIAEALRRKASNSPCYTTEQVLEHLRSLEGR